MLPDTAPVAPWIGDLIARRTPWFSLEREFYGHEEIYRLDLERIWRRGWLFAGHSCQASQPGAYFTLNAGADSILLVRGDDGALRALHNVCRHRGSLIATEEEGRVGRLVCPYHQWVYGLDGALQSCWGMPPDFDRSPYGLISVHVREFEGLIFVCLADDPPAFEEALATLGPAARPQGFGRAKVAKMIDYVIEANWKLVWENNRECYHCNVNHPQYIKANFDHYDRDGLAVSVRQRLEAALERGEAQWEAAGLAIDHRRVGMATFPDPDRGVWYSATRTVLAEGFVTESMDGKPVGPPMGDYPDIDVGTLRMRALPNFWNHSSRDHGVTTRLLPAGPERTLARVFWLVHEDAEEGKDYRLETMLPFWQLTSEQDWELARLAQRGVNSSAYRPGPYSTTKEPNVEAFVRWYLGQLGPDPGKGN